MPMKLFTIGGSGLLDKRIDTAGNGTFVGQITTNASFILGTSAADEGGVVDEAVFGGVALGFQRSEKGLLSTQNLHRRRRGLGQAGERTRLLNEARRYRLTDQGGQIGRDIAHLVLKVTK